MAKKQTDVVFFVEHVSRDLDVATAVKHLAEKQHGVAIEIASIVMHRRAVLDEYEPRVVALPYGTSAGAYGMSDILGTWPDSAYFNLAYEQIFRKHQLVAKAPGDAFAREHLLHHAWGDFYKTYLKQHGVPDDNIFVNGNPTYALYKDPYVGYFESRDELSQKHGLDPDKPWIFIPENYGAAFGTDRAVRRPVEGGTADANEVRRYAEDSLREVVTWWSRAAEAKTAEVIIRPRPATPKAALMKACRDVVGQLPEGLRFIKDGTVREWILASDVVASSYSTSLIEAAIAGKPVSMLAPKKFPNSMHSAWYDLVPEVDSLDGFISLVNGVEPMVDSRPLKAWAETEMLSHGDPIARLAETLASIAKGETRVPERPIHLRREAATARQSNGTGFGQIWRRVARRVVRRGIGREGLRRTSHHEGDGFDADEVRRRVSKWSEVLG